MKHLRILALAATALMGAATAASAQRAYTTSDVNMRAGPGSRFPVVTTLPGDSRVFIHGCLSNWDWCDVSWRRTRGWVFSDFLEAVYRNRRIVFDEYRGYADIPFVTFGFGYWDRYYRDRPWYDSWDRWGDRNDRRWRERNRDHGEDGWTGDNERTNTRNARRGDSRWDEGDDTDQVRLRCPPDDPACDEAEGSRRGHRMRQTDEPMGQQMDMQQ